MNGLIKKISAMAIVNSIISSDNRLDWAVPQLKDNFSMVKMDGQVFVLPTKSEVLATAKTIRDDCVTAHTRNGNNVRNRVSGRFVKTDNFETRMSSCSKVINKLLTR